jgi:MFS family permease
MPRLRLHYAWVVAFVTFIVLLVTAGIRATPGILMVPLESEFGWNRAVISAAVAINIALFGLIGPFAASVMDRWGLRRVILAAVALLAASVALSTQMRSQWQLTLLWGVLIGTGTGVTSMVLAAVVATRWFDERRGVVLGALSAANATGQRLDWIATVPPTVRLTSEAFGRENTGVVYGWIGASHQLGASLAAFGAGAIRTVSGDYRFAFWIAGALCVLAGLSFLTLGRRVFRASPSVPALVAATSHR